MRTMNALSKDKSWTVAAGIAVASAGALGLALLAQFGFALWPCALCLAQRVPYALALVAALLALLPQVDAPSRRQIVLVCAGLFLLNAGLALYHVGVEEHWWAGPVTCVGGPQQFSLQDLTTALQRPGRTGCEEAAFRLFGISMAGYNIGVGLLLAGGLLWAASRRRWWTTS